MTGERFSDLVEQLGEVILPRKWKVASAESCTGGLIACSIVGDIVASGAFERGFVVYSVDAKCELLGLERKRVSECGGVARDIAEAMARAALSRSHADLAVATTGFAGPRETDEEVGLVYVSAASKRGVRSRTLRLGDIGRDAVNSKAVEVSLELLIEAARDLATGEGSDGYKHGN